jgi:L-ascorbate metabolism protein UlaG (beta-lactamase superfamily)
VSVAVLGPIVASLAWAQGEVTLEWYGHAFVRLTSPQGVRVAMDPFKDIGYPMQKVEAEIVTVSHEHSDHNNAKLISGNPVVLRGLTEGGEDWTTINVLHKDVGVTSVPVYHDAQQGTVRGKNNMMVVDLGGLRVAHLSDMGHIPTEAKLQALGRVDLLLIPVGGNFSIDGRQARQIVERLNPRVAIPIHYKTAATARWPIEDERAFVEGYPRVKRIAGSRITLNPGTLPSLTEIWVLEPPLGK